MKKEVKYIQFPPIPEDIEMPALAAIWMIAKMDQEERKAALEQIKAMLGDEDSGEIDHATMQEVLDKYGNAEEGTVFSQYIECLRELVAYLIIESYDVAAYVYQKYCVEKLSLEEMKKTTRLSEDVLKLLVKYFDVRHTEN